MQSFPPHQSAKRDLAGAGTQQSPDPSTTTTKGELLRRILRACTEAQSLALAEENGDVPSIEISISLADAACAWSNGHRAEAAGHFALALAYVRLLADEWPTLLKRVGSQKSLLSTDAYIGKTGGNDESLGPIFDNPLACIRNLTSRAAQALIRDDPKMANEMLRFVLESMKVANFVSNTVIDAETDVKRTGA